MADILSLSKARKAKARSDKQAVAEANRINFGRTKAEKLRDKIEKTRAQKQTEAHKIDR